MRNLTAIAANQHTEAHALAQLARISRWRGKPAPAARRDRSQHGSPRVQRIAAKAAIGAMNTDDAEALVDMQAVTAGFASYIRGSSVFAKALDIGMFKVPLETRFGIVTTAAVGYTPGEALPTPLTAIGVDGGVFLEPLVAASLIVVSAELLMATQSEGVLSRELRRALSHAISVDSSPPSSTARRRPSPRPGANSKASSPICVPCWTTSIRKPRAGRCWRRRLNWFAAQRQPTASAVRGRSRLSTLPAAVCGAFRSWRPTRWRLGRPS